MNWFYLPVYIFFLFSDHPSEKEIRRAIQMPAEEYSEARDWFAKNDDSSFYKLDTIKLVKNLNYEYHADGNCKFIEMRFQGRSVVDISESILCYEPPLAIYENGRGHLHYSLKETNNDLILSFENKFSKQQFRIISLQAIKLGEKGDSAKELILVRKK